MQVLVMGGSLFNGRSLVAELVAQDHQVAVCNRGRTPVDHPPGVEQLTADRTERDELAAVLAGREWDAVVDMSAYHPPDVETMIELLGGRVGHYVFISSTVVYATGAPCPIGEDAPDDRGPDQNEYGLHKLLCEDVLDAAHRESGFPATTVLLSMVFGPHNALPDREQRMFHRLETGRPILVPGDGTTQGIIGHVDDQSRALVALLGVEASFGRRFNCTGTDPHTDQSYVDTLAEVVGATPQVVPIPAPTMDRLWDGEIPLAPPGGSRPTMDIRPTADALGRAIPHAHRFQLANLVQRLQPNLHRWDTDVVFDVTALMEVTGWRPQFDFAAAAADTYRWWHDSDHRSTLEFDYGWEDDLLERVRP